MGAYEKMSERNTVDHVQRALSDLSRAHAALKGSMAKRRTLRKLRDLINIFEPQLQAAMTEYKNQYRAKYQQQQTQQKHGCR